MAYVFLLFVFTLPGRVQYHLLVLTKQLCNIFFIINSDDRLCSLLIQYFTYSVQLSSVQTLSHVWLCDPMDCRTTGLPVHHQLPEFTQTHDHWDSDAIQLSILCHPLCLSHSIFPSIGSFFSQKVPCISGQNIGTSALTSVLPMNTQDWFPLGWTGWISLQSKGLSRVFFKSINLSLLSFHYSPNITSIHNYWKNHSLD